ncbi:MAG: GNAT family N-acetyltransferase [Emergencia sp.]
MKTLETERLRLTMFTMEDAADLYDYAKNPNVGPHAGWSPHKSREESEIIIRDLFLPNETWAIRMKDETKADEKPGKVIGSISWNRIGIDRMRTVKNWGILYQRITGNRES